MVHQSADDDDAVAAKRRRKEAKRALKELDAQREALTLELQGIDAAEKKHAAKAAAREALAYEMEEACTKEAKRVAKAARRAAVVTLDEVAGRNGTGHAETQRSKCTAQCLAEEAATNKSGGLEVDPAEAKRLRKAAKRAAAGLELHPADAKRLGKAAAEVTGITKAFTATSGKDAAATAANRLKKDAKQSAAQAAVATDAARNTSKNSSDALTVFVGCIPFSVSEATLWKDFSECGEIKELILPDAADGRKGGFAFITFKTREAVEAALKYNGDMYAGRKLVVKIDGKVFVKGIPNGAQDSEVEQFFGACGEIQSVSVPRWPDGGAKGSAHINFKTREGLEAALDLNGTLYGTFTLSVQKAAQSKDGKGKGKGGKSK